MATSKKQAASRDWLTLFNVGAIRDLTDGQLLERFALGAGEPAELAFAALVERHGPMVLRVCRAELRDSNDVHDAFQAVFLVLVRKARGLWVKDSLGPWLHQVACRTVRAARSNAARRQRFEERAAVSVVEPASKIPYDLHRVIHEEIDRLPDRYRAPVILCDLEGRTHEQAARHLGWPVGTVKSRQSRARERLKDRLTRRGLAPGVGTSLAFKGTAELASLPQALIDSTSRIAVQAISTKALVKTSSMILTREVIRSMLLLRLCKVVSVLLISAGTVTGAGLAARTLAPDDDPEQVAASRANDDGVATIEVKVGREARIFKQIGALDAVEREDQVNQVEGLTTILFIKPEGTEVKKGELVCELDATSLRDRLINQQIAKKQAEQKVDEAVIALDIATLASREYENGTLKHQKVELSNAIDLATTSIEKATARRDRSRLALKQLDELLSAKGQPASAGDLVTQFELADRIDASEELIARETKSIELAKSRLDVLASLTAPRILNGHRAEIKRKEGDILAAKATQSLEELREKKLRKQIEYCKVLAPADGIVIYANDQSTTRNVPKPAIAEGETVRERQKLFSIVNLRGPMRVNAKIPEAIVDQIYSGQKARIKVDALPDKVFEGVVKAVQPFPDRSDPANPQKVYTTLVELTTSDPMLRPGMTAQAEIQTVDMLSVPMKATYQVDGKPYVAVKKADGTFEPRKLNAKYGIPGEWFVVASNPTDKTAIGTVGIQAGDTIAADPTFLLKGEHGDKLRNPREESSQAGPKR